MKGGTRETMTSVKNHPILARIHSDLGIPSDYQEKTGLPFYQEVELSSLVVAQLDGAGRPLVLTAAATAAWGALRTAACGEGVDLQPFSGFRSYVYQQGIIAGKLAKGIAIADILRSLAAPGFSEHHTGEAIDITTVRCPPGEEEFEKTSAYQWLVANARKFGFTESFPRSNPHNLVYEPWHWKFSSK